MRRRSAAPLLRTIVSEADRSRSHGLAGHLVGTLRAVTEEGGWVDYPGNPHGPLLARTTVALAEQHVGEHSVLLVFDGDRSEHPVIVGVLQGKAQSTPTAVAPRLEASVDGNRVVLEAADEIVLRCGKASITLRRNGRVVLRGAYIETQSTGVNRIRGGTVKVN
ncbi:MAG TPA: DUF6484 domain-containing protein [Polyangiales bacterium]|nr:DUF6484 domain-containing protein [Polyangiales bacterium]